MFTEQDANSYKADPVEATPFYEFIVYPNRVDFSESNDNSINDIDKIRKIHEKLIQAISLPENKNQFDLIYRKLFNYGCEQLSNWSKLSYQQFVHVVGIFQGCEYLLVEQCRLLPPNESLELMKKYTIELCEKNIFAINIRAGFCNGNHNVDIMNENYTARINCIKNTSVKTDFSPLWNALQETFEKYNSYMKKIEGRQSICSEESKDILTFGRLDS